MGKETSAVSVYKNHILDQNPSWTLLDKHKDSTAMLWAWPFIRQKQKLIIIKRYRFR